MDKPHVFVLTLLAVRPEQNEPPIVGAAGASSVLTVQHSAEQAELLGWKQIHIVYPQVEGWIDHHVAVYEVPQTVETDGFQIAISVIPTRGT